MESYLKYTLGLHVDIQTWNDSKTLPDELRDDKEYMILTVCGVKCLVINENASEFQMTEFLKRKSEMMKYCDYPQVLCFERITSYQRKCLIEGGQAFIVPDNQLYMPFLGIALQEHFKAPAISGQQLTAMAQYILLFFLYNKDETEKYFSKLDISKKLDINLMNVSRSVQELEELSLAETRKKGRSSMVTTADRLSLYQKASGYMRNPVQKKLFVRTKDWLLELPVSGMEACSQLWKEEFADTKVLHRTRAIEKKKYLKCVQDIQEVDPAWERDADFLELEVWRYDPARFTDGHFVDSVSLALSTMGEADCAVKLNINKLLI